MSTYELCKRTGTAEGKVSVAKTRKNSFGSAIMLYRFAKELGITADELISGERQISEQERYRLIEKDRDEWKQKYENLLKKIHSFKQNINQINNDK